MCANIVLKPQQRMDEVCINGGKIILIFFACVAVIVLIYNTTYLDGQLHAVSQYGQNLRKVLPYPWQTVAIEVKTTTVRITTELQTTQQKQTNNSVPLLQTMGCRRMNLHLNHPQISLVASLGNGRLGNQLSNIASCYALWKEYGMYHHLNTMQLGLLEKTFVLPKLNADADNASYYLWNTGKFIKIHP